MYVQDKLNEINKNFYVIIEQVNQLNRTRALQVLTLLVNSSIASLFFPSYQSSLNMFRVKGDESVERLMMRERINEIIYGVCLLIILKYQGKNTVTHLKTDISIEYLRDFASSEVSNFFLLNFLPLNFKLDDIKEISENFIIEYKLLPDLDFDPKFQKILKSEAIQYLFHDINPKNLLEMPLKSKFVPNKELWYEITQEIFDMSRSPLDINPKLIIAEEARLFYRAYGTLYFGSELLIDEIINLFIEYFCDYIPSKEDQIRDNLLCYSVMLKTTKGKGYFEMNYKKLKDLMLTEVEESSVNTFLERVIYLKTYEDLKENWSKNQFKDLINSYQIFLRNAGFVYHGKIHTGVFLIWRSMIKYLETLQSDRKFKLLRGKLLENWAFSEIVKLDFWAEKLILLNATRINPSNNFYKMKKQIEGFPKFPLEIKVPFPKNYERYYFQEFDVAIRVQNYLFIIECKGTRIPKSEWPRVIYWLEKLRGEALLLRKKIRLLDKSLKSSGINHPFLNGVERIVQCHLKTEGVIDKFGTFSTRTFKNYFKTLKNYLDDDHFQEFEKKHLWEFKKR